VDLSYAYSLVHKTLLGQIYGYRLMCIVDLLSELYSIQLGLRVLSFGMPSQNMNFRDKC
jgi:hypothetical protein